MVTPERRVEKLSDEGMIAQGSERSVFTLKNSPETLLKVMRSKHLKSLQEKDDRSWIDWLRIRSAYSLFRREQRAWTDAMLRAASRDALPPLAGIGDFVLTPKGLGQLVERVCGPDGETAPTLEAILAEGALSEHHLAALNHFISEIYDWHIVAYDLGPANIVWQEDGSRFLLVDGFGDRSRLPLKTWIKRVNDRRLDSAFARMATKAGLDWHRESRRVTLPKHANQTQVGPASV